ncbi:MAG: phosphoribosylaminoimidazolesuccinocarboxamide synthase [Gemmatimonadetes bacterium]|nr:phosphoribosylaminoimidazolesuccinocarboxamide synthase [Gemmatimonadota bacterium]
MSAYETATSLPEPAHRGKVRDVYDLGSQLILVATDRVSAFDVILGKPVPDKGRILTGISDWWFDQTRSVFPNHHITSDRANFPEPFRDEPGLDGRSTLVHKADRVDVECVVRGYLAGSGWKEYQQSRSVCGVPLPEGLNKGSRLPEPIFTPTTKADEGHDEPITFEQMVDMVGADLSEELRRVSIEVYEFGHRIAEERGFLLADTKFEFGRVDGELILIDEVLTPDSSRYWRVEDYTPGHPPESWDKQVIRDFLDAQDWDKTPPAPEVPDEIIHRARERYLDVYRALTGRELA